MTAAPPLVSCLMVTRGNLLPARFAVDAFRRQSWPHRELVIVCDAPAVELRGYLQTLADRSIRFVAAAEAPLGTLRNLAVAEANGAFCIQWDDDDLHAPQRIEAQMAVFDNQPVDAVFLHRWAMWWPREKRIAISGRRIWEGTMLARTEAILPYPALPRGEDTAMAAAMHERSGFALLDRPDLYCYVIHGRNAWEAAHFEMLFANATQRFEHDTYEAARAQLAAKLPLDAYAEGLRG